MRQPTDSIFVKGYEFLTFAKNITKNIDKNISKKLSGKYSRKLLHHAKQSAPDALKTTSKWVVQKTAEATEYLIGNKIVDRITKFWKIYHKIIQKQLTMSMIKKYLNKDMYLKKKDRELLMNWD